MATGHSSSYLPAQSFSDQLVGEAMFRASVTLALARSSEPQDLLDSDPKVAVFQVLGFAYDSLQEPEPAADRYFAPVHRAFTAAVPMEQSDKRSSPTIRNKQ
ncbi:hypothetical protein N7448_011422 [Penicillium atrosanguineum]|nr:hypothetical protein N7448_011422 [Penicillium atrosanguineum]